jgi:hypothetical protein
LIPPKNPGSPFDKAQGERELPKEHLRFPFMLSRRSMKSRFSAKSDLEFYASFAVMIF